MFQVPAVAKTTVLVSVIWFFFCTHHPSCFLAPANCQQGFPEASGFFAFSPWMNLACDSPTCAGSRRDDASMRDDTAKWCAMMEYGCLFLDVRYIITWKCRCLYIGCRILRGSKAYLEWHVHMTLIKDREIGLIRSFQQTSILGTWIFLWHWFQPLLLSIVLICPDLLMPKLCQNPISRHHIKGM